MHAADYLRCKVETGLGFRACVVCVRARVLVSACLLSGRGISRRNRGDTKELLCWIFDFSIFSPSAAALLE